MTPDSVVYLVDDDPGVRRAMARLLRAAGYQVATYGSAAEFLEAKSPDGPGCLVLDVRMPEVGGLELQQSLLRSGQSRPIVFITGHGDIPTSVQAMKAGAVDFLTKPVAEKDLLAAVDRALARDATERQKRTADQSLRDRVARLSSRERQIFELVTAGLLNKQIGARLGTGERTVKLHRARVMKKLEAESTADLVRIAERLGIEPANVSPLDIRKQ
jgi:FixJ family two-component response regulator